MLGTHISLLQTGGWKEARFSSTQDFTFIRCSMVGRQDSSAHRVLPGSRAVGEVSQPSLLWVTSLINLPEDKEQSNPLPPRCVTLGYDPDLIPAPAYRRGRALQSRLLGPGQHLLGT